MSDRKEMTGRESGEYLNYSKDQKEYVDGY